VVARLRTAAADALTLLEYAIGSDAFKTGVTDPTGSIDEGDVRASGIINELRKALEGPHYGDTSRCSECRTPITYMPRAGWSHDRAGGGEWAITAHHGAMPEGVSHEG